MSQFFGIQNLINVTKLLLIQFTPNNSDMVFHDITPAIRHLRKILVTELMSIRQLESSRYIRMEEMASTLHKIANENGPTCINMHVTFMTTNVLSRMIFNKWFLRVEEQDDGAKMVQVLMFVIFFQNLA